MLKLKIKNKLALAEKQISVWLFQNVNICIDNEFNIINTQM